jgi:hypothetical protein
MAIVVLILGALFVAGCGGGEETAATTVATTTETTVAGAAGGTTVGSGQAETVRDVSFVLNTDQPVPPDFKAAYDRNALIVVQFYKTGQDPFYPQGLEIDEVVNESVNALSSDYPTVEFFEYEITNPGDISAASLGNSQTEGTTAGEATNGEGDSGDTAAPPPLAAGEYGTLPAQLGVGYTPFLATLTPSGDGYIIENLFQGYIPRPVVNQALFDLAADGGVEGNTSDVDVVIDQFELTEDGKSLEYVDIRNRSKEQVNLQGFTFRVLDPETGDADSSGGEASINDKVAIKPKRSGSVGRDDKVVDSDGEPVDGTFETSDAGLNLAPGDQLALLDSGGAIAFTITI